MRQIKLTSQQIEDILNEHHLLIKSADVNATFDFLHYDTRQVRNNTLFVVKGAFKSEYLADAQGVTGLIVEQPLTPQSLGGQAIWNCRNSKGNRVASGIYLVLSSTENSKESVVTKIAVIK